MWKDGKVEATTQEEIGGFPTQSMVQQLDHDSFMAQRLLLHERIQRGEENCRATAAANELYTRHN